MHQKERVRQAWAEAGLYRTDDAKLRRFLEHLDAARTECWPELVAMCRTRYPEYKEILARPLWNTGDKLLRLNLIRAAHTSLKDEVSLVESFVKDSHPLEDQQELQAVVHLGHAHLAAVVAAKPGAPRDLVAFAREHATGVGVPHETASGAAVEPDHPQRGGDAISVDAKASVGKPSARVKAAHADRRRRK